MVKTSSGMIKKAVVAVSEADKELLIEVPCLLW